MRGAVSSVLAVASALLLAACDSGPIAEAKDGVSRYMLDPDATQFREMAVCSHDPKVVSGEFNAKNGFGAYTGFKSFFYAEGQYATSEDHERFRALMVRCYSPEIVKQTDDFVASVESSSSATRGE